MRRLRYRGFKDIERWSWQPSPSERLPDNMPIIRDSFPASGWRMDLQGETSNVGEGLKIKGFFINSFVNNGNQGWLVQWGTTTIPVALSTTIFFKTLKIKANDGNAQNNPTECHSLVKASTANASGSFSQEKYFSHFVLHRVANKSISGSRSYSLAKRVVC